MIDELTYKYRTGLKYRNSVIHTSVSTDRKRGMLKRQNWTDISRQADEWKRRGQTDGRTSRQTYRRTKKKEREKERERKLKAAHLSITLSSPLLPYLELSLATVSGRCPLLGDYAYNWITLFFSLLSKNNLTRKGAMPVMWPQKKTLLTQRNCRIYSYVVWWFYLFIFFYFLISSLFSLRVSHMIPSDCGFVF